MKTLSNSINPAVKDFDSLPQSAQIRPHAAAILMGISIATFWRMVRQGKLKTQKLTERTTTVNVGELRALLTSKVEG